MNIARHALSLALAAAAAAQDRLPQGLVLPLVPIHTAAPDLGVPYGTWAAGDGYKVSFHDGMTFVPYLGEDYPHNQPWSWRTTSVRLGGRELLPPGAAPAHRHTDWRYEYDFGAVTEAYDVRREGLEQTFVLRHLPAAGDLVVTGAVTSALTAPDVIAAHQALEYFDTAGSAILRYGRAWVIDANGNRLPITTELAGERITLTVPGEWLAGAVLPVTVDPLLTPSPATYQQGLKHVDIGHDDGATSNNIMFAVVSSASQFDDDVVLVITSYFPAPAFFAPGTSVFYDITSSWDSDDARCAMVDETRRWVSVFRRYFASDPIRSSQLRGHMHPRNSTTGSTTYAILSPPPGINDWRCNVGGTRKDDRGIYAMVVFQREDNTNTAGHWADTATSAVYGVRFDTGGNGSFGTPFLILGGPTRDCARPSINSTGIGSSSMAWVCALQVYDNNVHPADDLDLALLRITSSAQVSLPALVDVGSGDTEHKLGPVVEGYGPRYAVTFTTADVVSAPGNIAITRGQKLWVQRFDDPFSTSGPVMPHPPVMLISDPARILEAGGIGYAIDGSSHFAIGYRTVNVAAPVAGCLRVGYRGRITEGPTILATTATTPVACVYDDSANDFLFAYGVPGTGAVFGHPLAWAPAPAPAMSGSSCNATSLGWWGSQQIGGDLSEVRVVGATSQAVHLLLVAVATADLAAVHPAVLPGCRLLVDALGPGYLGALPIAVAGNPYWNLPLPEFLQPTTLYFQDWMLAGTGLTSTRRLEVQIVK